jgi:chromosome segregation ATPase
MTDPLTRMGLELEEAEKRIAELTAELEHVRAERDEFWAERNGLKSALEAHRAAHEKTKAELEITKANAATQHRLSMEALKEERAHSAKLREALSVIAKGTGDHWSKNAAVAALGEAGGKE